MSDLKKTKPRSPSPTGQNTYPAGPIRERILKAAFSLFSESGFSATSMLDIVTRARVSKRDLYALFPNKHALLAACIHERAGRMRRPLDTAAPVPQTRDALTKLLVEFGVSVLKTVCQPEVLTVYRLAIAESDRAPEIARTLDNSGREANHKTLAQLLAKAQERRLVANADPAALAARYFTMLWGDLLLGLLMRVRKAPTAREFRPMPVRRRKPCSADFHSTMKYRNRPIGERKTLRVVRECLRLGPRYWVFRCGRPGASGQSAARILLLPRFQTDLRIAAMAHHEMCLLPNRRNSLVLCYHSALNLICR